MPESEKTGLIWADTMDGKWEEKWSKSHNVVAPPVINGAAMKLHAWNANAWTARKSMESSLVAGKNGWKNLDWSNTPLANHLIMTGLIATVSGVPIDLGMPGWINIKACRKAKLLDLASK